MGDTPIEHVEFDNTVARNESEDALEVEFDDGEKRWIPKSLIHDDSECYELGTDGTIYIPEWLAISKGLV